MWHSPSSQATQELELLRGLPLFMLCITGAAAIEAGGAIVRSAASAPGKLHKAPNARASSISAEHSQ